MDVSYGRTLDSLRTKYGCNLLRLLSLTCVVCKEPFLYYLLQLSLRPEA